MLLATVVSRRTASQTTDTTTGYLWGKVAPFRHLLGLGAAGKLSWPVEKTSEVGGAIGEQRQEEGFFSPLQKVRAGRRRGPKLA